MSTDSRRWIPACLLIAAALYLGAAGQSASAFQAKETITASKGASFIGEWKLVMETQRGVSEMDLSVKDYAGNLAATISGGFGGGDEPTEVEKIALAEGVLSLTYEASMRGQTFENVMSLKLDEGKIAGELSFAGGQFRLDVEGSRAGESAEGAPATQRRRRSRFSRGMPPAELTLGESKITVTIGAKIPTTDKDYAQIAEPTEGKVVSFLGMAAIRLRNEASLDFGGTVIKTGIHAEGYPGTYSLWLKKAPEGWRLVFNQKADVWGIQHDPEGDIAEIALEVAELDEPVANFTAVLEEAGDGGVLKLQWGATQWSAKFSPVQ